MKYLIKNKKMGKDNLNLGNGAKEIQSNFSSSMSRLINVTLNKYFKNLLGHLK